MSGTTFDVDVIAAGEPRVLAFSQGATIFNRGDEGDCAYIIKEGRVEIREGDLALEALCAGEIFGEMALIDDAPRTASAVAASRVELIPIDRRMFNVLIRDDPDFATTVMRLMSRRLRATTRLLAEDRVPGTSAGAVESAA
jgi:CRP-like cAMP-binding protein